MTARHIVMKSLCASPPLLDVAAKVCIQPFVAELIAKLEVFGSFLGLSLTGEMRTLLAAIPT
jgi:hypothetical protein